MEHGKHEKEMKKHKKEMRMKAVKKMLKK